ncbi:MAG TPA: PAS domain S-box protein [Candidatus Fermentibacter daniensis]|nr:PAS domain S-box protein [Candidatus Fermentibacter sp.]HOA04588.1 PAS domain S-box protein [Candidatus Fermentibacter daniensis]HOD18959.1 PAS domain S-box protein [Candidatus Fermentibacter daniensis]HOZ17741.1 PAS domain S-box protein [Candidatus Fermentibacter daniensis]HPH39416.1 PAS domain S-box protein [Candidatus Fermentibacter daniensis]
MKKPSLLAAVVWVAGALLLLTAAGALILDTERRQAGKNAWSELESIAGFSSEQIGIWRLDQIMDAGAISTDPLLTPLVPAFLASRSGPTASMLQSFFRQKMLEHSYLDIMLVDSSGTVLLSGSDPPLFPDGLPGEWLRSIEDTLEAPLVDMYVQPGDSAPHVSVVAPLPDESGRMRVPFACLILISDASAFLEPILSPGPSIDEAVEVVLIEVHDDDARFLSPPERSGLDACDIRIPSYGSGQVEAQAASGARGTLSGTAYHGGRVLAAAASVEGSPWVLIAMMEESEVTGGLRSRFGLLIGLLVLSAFTICFGGLFLWQHEKKRHFEELYRSESRLRASQDRQGITLRAVDDAVISADLAGRVDQMNPVAEELTGWSSTDSAGRPVSEVFRTIDPDSGEPVDDPVAGVLAEGRGTRPSRAILLARDGRRTPIEHSVSPILDSGMEPAGVVLVFRDRTDELLGRGVIEIRLELIRSIAELPRDEFLSYAAGSVLSLVGASEGLFCTVGADGKPEAFISWSGGCESESDGGFCPSGQHPALMDVLERCLVDGVPISSRSGDGASMTAAVPVSREGSTAALFAASGIPSLLFKRRMQILEYFASVILDLMEGRKIESALKESQRRYREIFDGGRDGMVMVSPGGRILEANPAYCEMLGYAPGELVGAADPLFPTDDQNKGTIARPHDGGGGIESGFYAMRLVRKDGAPILVEVRAYSVPDQDGRPEYRWYLTRDITESERLALETEQLRTQLEQARKLEAIGRLAGGVAHDFNNLLMGIMNYAELCRDSTAPGNPIRKWLDEIVNITNRSAELVKHLLAFARKQAVSPRALDINDAVTNMLRMLRRLIGEDIELNWIPGQDTRTILIDPAQFDQLLVNMALNARDAMDGPGTLTIESVNSQFDAGDCRVHPECTPGAYSTVIISDSGRGMEPDVIPHIFEPFFTTKGTGEGSGLGLATVHGIVRQNNGFITVYSEPGRGTTFRIHFPSHEGIPIRSGPVDTSVEQTAGDETVLLVEDEEAVRTTVEAFLNRLGYRVLAAEGPEQALEVAAAFQERIDLLLTDVVMPGMNVRDLVAGMKQMHPDIRCLYMSGYTSNVIVHRGILDDAVDFLAKPFTRDQLGRKLREMLERKC